MEKQDEIGGDTAKAKHTPGPWEVCSHAHIFTTNGAANADGLRCADNDGWQIADCAVGVTSVDGELLDLTAKEQRANAAFIVRACNGWYELIAALRELQANPNDPRAHRTALDAIAKASEQQ